jgi:tol-pal system protein YbgF
MGSSLPSSLRALTVAFSLLGLPACWVSTEKGRMMEADIVKMKAEYASQHKEFTDEAARSERERAKLREEQDAALKRIDSKILEVSTALEGLNHAARKTGADLGVELENAQKEIAALRGLVEELQAKSTALDTNVTQFRQETQTRLAAGDAMLKEWTDARKGAAKTADRPVSKEAFYDLAKLKMDSASYDEARALFVEFLQKWKDDPLCGNAQYWIGESYYAEKRYREAGIEFQKVHDKYPKSDKAPDSMLKVGFSFAELSMMSESKLLLEDVIHTYPKSPAAKLAKEKLAELGKHSK